VSKLILSIDGGGIRGAAVTQFLSQIESRLRTDHNVSIRDCVDFYAGTSTGGIIALALATTDLPVKKINELYSPGNAAKIFAENKGWLEIDGVNAPKYEASGKTKVLKSNLGDAKIGDVPLDKHVLAVTYGIERRRPEVIKSTKPEHLDLFVRDVADASSAAPTYFPTKEMDLENRQLPAWLVDGGVTANNPTMCAIAEARRAWSIPLDELRVVSIGTGYRTRKINGPASRKWGAVQWFAQGHIMDVLTDERVVAYQSMTITKPGNYIRVNAELKRQPGLPSSPDDAMDDISARNIESLKQLGDFWFVQYGDAVIDLMLGQYDGPSLDHIDSATGAPKIV